MIPVILLLAAVAVAAVEEVTAYPVGEPPASAPTTTPSAEPKKDEDKVAGPTLSGYLLPTFALRRRAGALPKDTWAYGVQNTAAGLVLEQAILPTLGYTLYAELNVNELSFEEATIYVQPLAMLKLKVGRMLVPFMEESLAILTRRLFPDRAAPTSYFLSGTDLGVLAEVKVPGDIATVSGGVFNGNGVTIGEGKDRGRMYALRADVAPLGAVPATVDTKGGGPRVAAGTGLVYYPSVVFDDAGFVSAHASDVRLDLSLKVAVKGFSFQTEYMRRQRSDSVTDLIDRASGWYAQAAYYHQLTKVFGIASIARYGTVGSDQTFVRRTTRWLEAGMSLYTAKGDKPTGGGKLTLIYSGEFRPTEGDSAHGATLQYLLTF
ncbi:MAG: porin [Myxococcota bacterium]